MNAPETWTSTHPAPSDADWMAAHWMPFTANRQFKASQIGRAHV